jgi:hypothetical protein
LVLLPSEKESLLEMELQRGVANVKLEVGANIRHGKGKPWPLIHGMGGSWRSWSPILHDLAVELEVIASISRGSEKRRL